MPGSKMLTIDLSKLAPATQGRVLDALRSILDFERASTKQFLDECAAADATCPPELSSADKSARTEMRGWLEGAEEARTAVMDLQVMLRDEQRARTKS